MSTAPLIKPTLPSLPSRLFFLHIRPSPIRTLSQIAVVLWPYLTPFHHTHRCITYAQGLGLLHNSFVSLHFNDAVHPPSRPLPFTWMRACPTPPSTPLRPFHRFILGCNASFSRLTPAHFPQHACTTSLSTRHRSSHPPFARTHVARRSHPSTRFSKLPPHSSSPLIAGLYILFSVAMAKPCCYLQRYVACCGCIHLPPTLAPSGRPAEICN